MSKLRKMFLVLSLIAVASQCFAGFSIDAVKHYTYTGSERPALTLDEGCILDFTGFTSGTYSGSMNWPGGQEIYYMSGSVFTNSCTPGVSLYTYCIDLSHRQDIDPYCATFNVAHVNPLYPEQYPAMGFVLSDYPVTNAQEDRIVQLAIWKLSTDQGTGSPTRGIPYYRINAGRGYPNFFDTPAYPFVNTVYNTNAAENMAANEIVRYVLGATDAIKKNVIIEGDQLLVTQGMTVSRGEDVDIPFSVTLQRGSLARSLGNTYVAGVKITVTSNHGTLNTTSAFTNAQGVATFTLTQVRGLQSGIVVNICSKGVWPMMIIPCETGSSQTLVVQSRTAGAMDTVCTTLQISPDNFLAVELASFTANAQDDAIALHWQTASEQNTVSWEIQRSISGAEQYSRIAIQPAVNSATGASYTVIDETVVAGVRYDYRLVDIDINGIRTIHENVQTVYATGNTVNLATAFYLDGNFPNPFNSETNIRFSLAEAKETSLKVYDLTGREIAVLVQGEMSAGEHNVSFNANNIPSGVYFYTLTSGELSATKKMLFLK